ncbi:endonuclease G, mitochondrial-like [Saccostrea echinata]|uniref:endonuclease G, mitochondrial-like n=1 Tax=Saccostrea echinata TaxID=191078 RepID=UPI002A83B8B0|nr:endonuclease G, mitochondrial-like [Saccostrea echinata]
MSRFAKIGLPLSCTGFGLILGVCYERNKGHFNFLTSENILKAEGRFKDDCVKEQFLSDTLQSFFPTVYASSQLIKPRSRLQEIFTFGEPSFDPLRPFEDHVVLYDRRNRVPHWVFEHIRKEHVEKNENVTRPSGFTEDQSIHPFFRATDSDYRGSGYDRGHMAAASNHRHSQKAMDDTFFFTNIAPQVGKGFNRGVWKDLEKYVRVLARKHRNVYVCTGPLYLPRLEPDGKLYVKYEVIGKNNVSVPTHFFKVVVMENEKGEFAMNSFVIPNQIFPKNTPLKNFEVPVEEIEKAAGFLLFEGVPKHKLKKINENI